jgi:putative SOS response-associated peptidase YedK
MCYYSKQTTDAQTLENRFNLLPVGELPIKSDRFNGFTNPLTPIITNTQKNNIQLYSWGLIPSWAKDESFRKNTLNARIESLDEKPSYRNYIKNRCLIVVDGFYEWQWLDPAGKDKLQYLITLPNEELFAFAGIYSTWTNKLTGEVINTYSMVTTEANELMAKVHNTKKRMPVILTKENEQDWLNPDVDYRLFSKCEIDLKAEPMY